MTDRPERGRPFRPSRMRAGGPRSDAVTRQSQMRAGGPRSDAAARQSQMRAGGPRSDAAARQSQMRGGRPRSDAAAGPSQTRARRPRSGVGPVRAAALAAVMLSPTIAQTPGPLPRDVEKIGDERYRIGKLTVDLKSKTAECPGRINMRRGPIEYLAVAPGGKLHESALELDVRPLHLQVGLILLGLEAGGGLRYQGDTRPPRGAPVELWVSWTRSGRSIRVPAGELVWDINRKRPMGAGSWVFSGLPAGDRAVTANEERSLIATYRDPAAVINTALEAGGDDTAFKVNERIAPPTGTSVLLMIKPAL